MVETNDPLTHPCSDFDGGNVCHWIDILHSCIVRVTIGEFHSYSSLVGHNVSIGDDESVAADDETWAVGNRDFPSRKRVPDKTAKQDLRQWLEVHTFIFISRFWRTFLPKTQKTFFSTLLKSSEMISYLVFDSELWLNSLFFVFLHNYHHFFLANNVIH